MVERLRVTRETVISRYPRGVRVFDTNYGRHEGGEYEAIELSYVGGLVLIYLQENPQVLAADLHYDPEIELPDSKSLLRFLVDLSTYADHLTKGYIATPDRLTIGRYAALGLVNLFAKRFEFVPIDDRYVLEFSKDSEIRKSRVANFTKRANELQENLKHYLSMRN